MYAVKSIAWEGGNAEPGDLVDETTIPDAVRARFIETGALSVDAPVPSEED